MKKYALAEQEHPSDRPLQITPFTTKKSEIVKMCKEWNARYKKPMTKAVLKMRQEMGMPIISTPVVDKYVIIVKD